MPKVKDLGRFRPRVGQSYLSKSGNNFRVVTAIKGNKVHFLFDGKHEGFLSLVGFIKVSYGLTYDHELSNTP